MAEETLRIVVEDTEVDEVLTKLERAMGIRDDLRKETDSDARRLEDIVVLGQGTEMQMDAYDLKALELEEELHEIDARMQHLTEQQKQWRDGLERTEQQWEKAFGGAVPGEEIKKAQTGLREIIKGLPTLRRSERLIATQIPMMRELLMGTYRVKMMAGATAPVAVGVSIIYILQIIRTLERIQKQMIRDMREFELGLRGELDITQEEFNALDRMIIGYENKWLEFQADWKVASELEYREGRAAQAKALRDYLLELFRGLSLPYIEDKLGLSEGLDHLNEALVSFGQDAGNIIDGFGKAAKDVLDEAMTAFEDALAVIEGTKIEPGDDGMAEALLE